MPAVTLFRHRDLPPFFPELKILEPEDSEQTLLKTSLSPLVSGSRTTCSIST